MAETKDPVAALSAKDIPTRAAGARDLSQMGGPEHLDLLLHSATTDKSPGVRLAAANAAADILGRFRLPSSRHEIPDSARERFLQVVAAVDAQLNTGLFQVTGVLALPASVTRVLSGLRDPRQDVRVGATVGLTRLLCSAAENGNTELEARVVALLADQKIRIETRAEIARICANVGYASALDGARVIAAQAIRQTQKLADETVARLEAPPQPVGIWVDYGCDAGEVNPKAKPCAWIAVLGVSEVVRADAKRVSTMACPQPVRVVTTPARDGEGTARVVQAATSTWWPADGDDICAFADLLLAAKAYASLEAVDPILGSGSAALRVRGAALLARGRAAEAVEVLESAVAGKRVPTDTWWFLADALKAAGRGGEARPHLEKYLSKAAKKAPFVDEARKRLG